MRPEEITLAIFEKYSPEEMTTTAQAMAQAQSDMEGAESEKKVSDGIFNERIKKHAAEVSELAQRYNKGGETAQIGCKIRYDIPTAGKKSYIRMDTEETVEVHDMSAEEKQETFQFPLSTAPTAEETKEAKANEAPAPKKSYTEKAAELDAKTAPPITEITFKDIQVIAAHIAKLKNGSRESAIAEMQRSIATKLLDRGKVIGPDGRLEAVESKEVADKLAAAWLLLALEETAKPQSTEEVTRICPYPGCILFAEHEGNHEFPKAEAQPQTDTAAPASQPEPKPEREKKATRKKKGFATPPDDEPPMQPGAPA